MEYRRVGNSGLVVSELSLGTATFAGVGEFFGAWGDTDVNKPADSSTSASKPESTSSTRRTSIPTVAPKGSSVKHCAAGETTC